MDYHYVREKVLHRDLSIRFVSSKDNLDDFFTKPLPALFQRHKILVDLSPCRLRGDVENVDNDSKPKPRLKHVEPRFRDCSARG